MYFIVGTFSSLSGRVLEFLESLSVFRYATENIAGSYVFFFPSTNFWKILEKKYPPKLYKILWCFFVPKSNYIYIYSDLDDFFFCTNRRAVAKIFRKVIGLKFFCPVLIRSENNVEINRKEGLYLHLNLMKRQLMTTITR